MTINNKKMFDFMYKVANRAYKVVNNSATKDENADFILLLFMHNHYNDKIKKVINHELTEKAEKSKDKLLKNYISDSRDLNKYIYLASSHDDCAVDHLPYQGKIYYDDKAPQEILEYAKSKGYQSIQWVMGKPAWFITRPNCRHFFKALPLDAVKGKSRKELMRNHKMHRSEGDKSLATPRKIVIEEYQDRLKFLKAMYAQHKTEHLRREITKTELLIKKHLNQL